MTDKLIVALDVPNVTMAETLVKTLGDTVNFYKVGLELFAAPDSRRFINALILQHKKVFLDLKMYDIPETVYRAVKNLNTSGIEYLTVHGCDIDNLEAAVSGAEGNIGILAVTVLTSTKTYDPENLLCIIRAKGAAQIGCTGIITSGVDIPKVRKHVSDDFVVVCPGIRPENVDHNDQKRVVTPTQAVKNGATHIVVGRPIRDAENPKQVASNILIDIEW